MRELYLNIRLLHKQTDSRCIVLRPSASLHLRKVTKSGYFRAVISSMLRKSTAGWSRGRSWSVVVATPARNESPTRLLTDYLQCPICKLDVTLPTGLPPSGIEAIDPSDTPLPTSAPNRPAPISRLREWFTPSSLPTTVPFLPRMARAAESSPHRAPLQDQDSASHVAAPSPPTERTGLLSASRDPHS